MTNQLSSRDPDAIVAAWLEEGPTKLPETTRRAVAVGLRSTRQNRRVLDVPWRPNTMTSFARLAVAAAAIVLVAGGALYLVSPGNQRVGGPSMPSPSALPLTPEPSQPAPGITGWTAYTSGVYGFTLAYPEDWSVYGSATRRWQEGDEPTAEAAYADRFASPEEATVGVWVWEMPISDGAVVDSWGGLEARAAEFCVEIGLSCDGIAENAQPMCLDREACHPALLVPTPQEQFAFITVPGANAIRVVLVGREDDFVSAARYGGSVALLESLLAQMDVWAAEPGQVQRGAASGAPSTPVVWEMFTSDRFGYQIEVPEGWTHGAPADDLPDELYPGDEGELGDRWDPPVLRAPWLIVAKVDPAPGETVDDWFNRNSTMLESFCDADQPTDIVVGGEQGFRLTYLCPTGIAGDAAFLAHAGSIYSIEIGGAPRDSETMVAILDHVLETFEFTGPA